jgi:hypothetical protein
VQRLGEREHVFPGALSYCMMGYIM